MKIILALLLIAPTFAASTEDLYGTWRLVSFTRTIVATGEVEVPYGKAPRGFLTYDRDGRMHAILAQDVRPPESARDVDRSGSTRVAAVLHGLHKHVFVRRPHRHPSRRAGVE